MKYQEQGARLRELRTAADKTLDEVGRHVGLSGPAARHWETGRSRPDADVARALDDLYGTGGEIVGLYGYAPEPGTVTLTAIDAKLDDLSAQVTTEIGSNTALAVELMRQMVENQRQMLADTAEILSRLPSPPSPRRSGRGARPARPAFD